MNLATFSSTDFENPRVQQHYAAVEAMALGDSMQWEAEADDTLKPDAARP